jgi:deoxycytidylate deaminase
LILETYKGCAIMHISMTDMLLKISIEKLLEEPFTPKGETIKKFRNCFIFDESKYEKAKEVNDLIKERKLHKITRADINIFEEYLSSIHTFYQELKKEFKPNDLGQLLQDLGDNARRCSNPVDFSTQFSKENAKSLVILAEEANNLIKFYRYRNKEKLDKTPIKNFVLEAFRNPYEIEFFRNRYYEFFLLSVNAPFTVRSSRKNWNIERDIRDQGHNIGKSEFYKQNVSKCVYLSDISVNNDSNLGRFGQKLAKYYALMNQPGCITPSYDELFMHQAYSMSLKSNCISRQVGAIIVGSEGYIVGAGWNDVGSGQIPCGQRKISDLNLTQNSFPIAAKDEDEKFISFIQLNNFSNQQHSFCYKDQCSLFSTAKKTDSVVDLNTWSKRNEISTEESNALSIIIQNKFSPKRLEYCRALHAEENAILQNAIIGGVGIKGGTIFTTTFPCELCAKKIYQSGIKVVVYTEPYPESISEDVFFKDGSHVVELVQFEGVKSHSYYRLFKSNVDKKEFQFQETI